jgi:D-alanine-D-alanine ligase
MTESAGRNNKRPRVGILFGGPSGEHEVSCASALAVVRALDRDQFEPVVIGITRQLELRLVPDSLLDRLIARPAGGLAIDDRLEAVGTPVELRSRRPRAAVVSIEHNAVLAELDVVFPLLHGPFGEDGVLQGMLEALGVPYAGCGVAASAVGMDKVAMKRAFVAEGLPVTPHIWFDEDRWHACGDHLPGLDRLAWPRYVKPANMGSSIGISRVTCRDELIEAVEEALGYDAVVLIEQGVQAAREIECGVLGGFDPASSVVGEVAVTGGWFDYGQKYLSAEDPMTVPADLPVAVAKEVRELSVRAFQAIGGWGLARADFLYDESGRLYLNELNTMPGFTAHSMYPKVWEATDLPYTELITRLIELAFERHARKSRPPKALSKSLSLRSIW